MKKSTLSNSLVDQAATSGHRGKLLTRTR